jgi:hypothetical protein
MPFTAAAIATGAIIAGTSVVVMGQRSASKTAAAVADQNAAALRVQSEQETQAAGEEQKRLVAEKERRTSRLRVLAANAGVDLVGTPLLLEQEIAGEFEEERQFVGQAGRQRRFRTEFAAGQEQAKASGIRRASPFQTGATILTGVSGAAQASTL